MNDHSKKECLDLIAEKKLPYTIKRIGQLDRLVSNIAGSDGRRESIPVFSWDRLYTKLMDM